MAKEQEAGGGTPVSDQLGRSLVEGEDRVTLEEEIDYYKSKLNEFETMDITGDLENPIKDYKAIAEKIIESKNNQYVIQLPKSKIVKLNSKNISIGGFDTINDISLPKFE